MHIRMTAAAVAATLLALAPAAAQDQFSISPPPGWSQVQGPDGVLGVWITPDANGFRQNLNLVSEEFGGTLSDYVAATRRSIAAQGQGVKFGPEADAKTCTSHTAHFLTWQSSMLGREMLFEQVLSVWDGRGYVLTYTRQSGEPELDVARTALTTLCIRQI